MLITATTTAGAASPQLGGLQVYAVHSIEAQRSDYQGSTAAGGAIHLEDFTIDGDLTAGGPLRFKRGQVHGAIGSPSAGLEQVFAARATGRTDAGYLSALSQQLAALSARLLCLPSTTQPRVTSGTIMGKPITLVRVKAQNGVDVADIPADKIASEGPDRLRIVLEGARDAGLIVRVRGESATLQNVGFTLQGGLTPDRVVFDFPDAKALTIASSGGASTADGTHLGVPGSVIAPGAVLRLAATTITGRVFADRIEPIDGLPSGQVNRFPDDRDRDGVRRSPQIFSDVAARAQTDCALAANP